MESAEQANSLRATDYRTFTSLLNPAFEIAEIGAWELDLSTNTVVASNECKALFGIAASEPFEMDRVTQMIHPEHRFEMEIAFRQAIDHKTPYQSEFCINHPDGSMRWLSCIGICSTENGNKMSGVTLDVTERKRATQVLKQLSTDTSFRTKGSTITTG